MKKHLITLLFFPLAVQAANIDVHTFDNAKQEADYRALISELRCPQCQNNNIADSNATISTDMRNKTLELLKQGKSKDEVVDYMIARYGNFVTYNPPLTPATLVLWLLPLCLLAFGGFFVVRRKKQKPQADKNAENSAHSPLDQDRLNQILNNKEQQ